MNIIFKKAASIKHFEYITNEGDGSDKLLQLIYDFAEGVERYKQPIRTNRFEMSPIISTILPDGRIHYQATLALYRDWE